MMYEVHKIGSNEAVNQNFSFLALNPAELAAPQISSKNRFFSLLTRFLGLKSPKT
jgi:hypothetical protein